MSEPMTTFLSNVSVVNPLTDGRWNSFVAKCSNSTIFHSANWARLLADTYGYHPRYLTLTDHGDFTACLPMMEVNSVLTGSRGVSLTFSDYCGALVVDSSDFEKLFESALLLGKTSGWRYAEFRGEDFLGQEAPAKSYLHHEIDLVPDEGTMHACLRESTARNIRKAMKEGVTVKMSQSLASVRDFYRLHCLTRKRQGVPPQPLQFFDNLHQHVISKGFGFTALASHNESTVAAIICLHFGNHAIYKYGASDLQFQHLRANNIVMWDSIMRCAREGYRTFSLGRTDGDNEGLISFKNGWGGKRTTLNYYRYDFATSRFVSYDDYDMGVCRRLLRRLPVSILKVLGTLAYRHMG
jgi:hypothetical protein